MAAPHVLNSAHGRPTVELKIRDLAMSDCGTSAGFTLKKRERAEISPGPSNHLQAVCPLAQLSMLASSYNRDSHELLVDSGFGGGVAVGARRPRLATTTTSYRALGDEVSAPIACATRSRATGNRPD
jgi:hypothetical protein